MHEMSVALEIRSLCERELERLGGGRLSAVGVRVGAFSGVEVETLEFCLEVLLSEHFDGVRCEIEREPGRAVCPSCGREFEVTRAPFECPECGLAALGANGGGSLHLSYLEVE